MAVIVVPVLCVTSTGSEDSWSCSVSASPDYFLFYTACRQPAMLSLCSVTACSVQPCVATTVSYTTQRRKCCLPPVPPLSPATLDMTFCLWKPLPHLPLPLPPADRTSITSRHCEKRAQKATPIEKRREE